MLNSDSHRLPIIEVVAYEDNKVIKTIEVKGGNPDKVDAGINANLDHENYYTRIVL